MKFPDSFLVCMLLNNQDSQLCEKIRHLLEGEGNVHDSKKYETICSNSTYDTPIPTLWYSLKTLDPTVVHYLHSLFGIDILHHHTAKSYENYTGINEIWDHEEKSSLVHVVYTMNYYTELRRLHSLLMGTFEFQYDLYVFYLYASYGIKSEITLEEFASTYSKNYEYTCEANYELYERWKKIIELLGCTEEDILSKKYENFLRDCKWYYEYISESDTSDSE